MYDDETKELLKKFIDHPDKERAIESFRMSQLAERMSELQKKVDSGRFTGAEAQRLKAMVEEYIKLDDQKAEYERMIRNIKVSVTELEVLVQLVGESIMSKFKSGCDKERIDTLQNLRKRLQEAITKEKP